MPPTPAPPVRAFSWQPQADRLRQALERFADALEARPFLVFALLTLVYLPIVYQTGIRLLWHDELYTFNIAHAPDFKTLIDDTRTLDLNPPLVYLLTRLSNHWFGDSAFATRLPSAIAFYGAMVFLFLYVRRKIGTLFAALALLLFWSTDYVLYCTEARPYALLLFFFSLTLFSYDSYARGSRRYASLVGIFLGGVGMVASHAFAPLSLAPFAAAELVRVVRQRRIDFALWTALILPLALLAFYLPMVRNFQSVLFPPAFQASPRTFVRLYWRLLASKPQALFCAFVAALMLTTPRSAGRSTGAGWNLYDVVIGLVLGIAVPALLTLTIMRTHGAFWDRYCITSCLAVAIAFGGWTAWRFAYSRVAAIAACFVLAIGALVSNVAIPRAELKTAPTSARVLDSVYPNLPIVVGNGVSFVEMDHREPLALQSRLYFLENRDAAIRYAHSTLFEGMGATARAFGMHAHVEPYSDFVREHSEFLVLSRLNWPENWILPKLQDDGDSVSNLGRYSIPYSDQDLFLVKVK